MKSLFLFSALVLFSHQTASAQSTSVVTLVCDGVSDNAPAINAQLNAWGWADLQWPRGGAGNCMSSAIILHDDSHLNCHNAPLQMPAGRNQNGIQSDAFGTTNLNKEITIENCSPDGNNSLNTSGSGIAVNGYLITIHNAHPRNWAQNGIESDGDIGPESPSGGPMENHFSNIRSCNNHGDGILFTGPHDSQFESVIGCKSVGIDLDIENVFQAANLHGWSAGLKNCLFPYGAQLVNSYCEGGTVAAMDINGVNAVSPYVANCNNSAGGTGILLSGPSTLIGGGSWGGCTSNWNGQVANLWPFNGAAQMLNLNNENQFSINNGVVQITGLANCALSVDANGFIKCGGNNVGGINPPTVDGAGQTNNGQSMAQWQAFADATVTVKAGDLVLLVTSYSTENGATGIAPTDNSGQGVIWAHNYAGSGLDVWSAVFPNAGTVDVKANYSAIAHYETATAVAVGGTSGMDGMPALNSVATTQANDMVLAVLPSATTPWTAVFSGLYQYIGEQVVAVAGTVVGPQGSLLIPLKGK